MKLFVFMSFVVHFTVKVIVLFSLCRSYIVTKITQTPRLNIRTTSTLWNDPRSNHTLRAKATITLTTSTTVKATSVSKNSHRVDHTMAMTCFLFCVFLELYSSYCTQRNLMSDLAFHHFLQESFSVHKLFLIISHGIWKKYSLFFLCCLFFLFPEKWLMNYLLDMNQKPGHPC